MARAPETPFEAFVRELFSGLGPVSIRRMFGGGGIYAGGVMFGLLADDTIYLKTTPALDPYFDAAGCPAFIFEPPNAAPIAMSYRRLPDGALDDPDMAAEWGRRSLDAQLAAVAARPTRKRKGPGANARA
jgi:DNA transformation protein and related proteins